MQAPPQARAMPSRPRRAVFDGSRRLAPPLPLLTASFAGGTLAAAVLDGPWLAMALAGGLLTSAALLRGYLTLPLAVVALAAGAAGYARYVEAQGAPLPPLASARGSHLVEGVVRADPQAKGRFGRLDLDVARLDGRPLSGGLRVTFVLDAAPPLEGDRVVVRGEIDDPPEIAAFDYPAYLQSREIYGVLGFPDELRVIARNEGTTATRALRALRRGAVHHIERSLPEPEASLAIGMLIGRQGNLAPDLESDLRNTGTSHLVVVSGQNVALVLATLTSLIATMLSRRLAALLVLASLPAYVVFVGAEPPVVRAAIMAVGITLGTVTGRRTPGWVYLLYAVAGMLAVDPALIHSVSFQLSATATAGVVLLAPPLRDAAAHLLHAGGRGLTFALIEVSATSTAALAAVLPVQAAVFESLPLTAVPANVLAAALYPAILLVGVLAALAGGIDVVADVVWIVGAAVPGLFVLMVGALARVEAAPLALTAPLLLGATWYAALGAATWALQRRPSFALETRGASRALAPLTLAIAALALAGTGAAVLARPAEAPSVTVLDVGQGLAVLVRGSACVALIDTGPPDGAALRALPQGNGRTIDALVVTHSSLDHAGGVAEVERRLRVHRRLEGAGSRADHTTLATGDRLELGPETWLEVLSPPRLVEGTPLERASENNRSLVLLVGLGDRRVLLTADIEAPTERWLVREGRLLPADALLVPHHGSRTSSTAEFVAAVQPAIAVVSAGADNQYGHPHPEVMARYEAIGTAVFNTAERGSVTLRLRNGALEVSTAR